MVRMGLSASLNVESDMEVVAEAANGETALVAYRHHQPSLVIMDVRLPGSSGVDATAAIVQEFPEARILMLSTHSGEEEVFRSLQAGACGYILKSAMREELLRAIREVCEGRRYVDPAVAPLLAARTQHRTLTGRELEVHADVSVDGTLQRDGVAAVVLDDGDERPGQQGDSCVAEYC